jgi:hypothetical protein
VATPVATEPYKELLDAVNSGWSANAATAVVAQGSFKEPNAWLARYLVDHSGKDATKLVIAAQSASVEVVAALSLGLARPAIFSLRSYFELFLMFLFYRDHPREFLKVYSSEEFALLPEPVVKFLARYYPEYAQRWAILDQHKTRSITDCYGKLSEIVHGSIATAPPKAVGPKDVVFDNASNVAVVDVIGNVCEYLSDVAVSAHEGNWMSLPDEVRQSLAKRKADKGLAKI